MAEHEGGAPHGAEIQEKIKTPEAELVPSKRAGLTARFCLAGEALNPENLTVSDITSIEQISDPKPGLIRMNKLSNNERKEYWENQGEPDASKRKEVWAEQVNATLLKKLTKGTEADKKAWKDFYGRYGIENPSKENLLAFYDKFFTGANKVRSTEAFIAETLLSYRPKENTPTDVKALSKDFDKIEWFANIFGEKSSKLIPSALQATLLSNDSLREELLTKANSKENGQTRLNRLTSEEKELLDALYKVTIEPVVPPTPQETKDEKPQQAKGETEPKEKQASLLISKEQMDILKQKKVKVAENEEITCADLVARVLDIEKGTIKDDLPKLDSEYKALKEELGKMSDAEKEKLDKRKNIIISPLAWSMIDAIAQKANEANKMLSFTLLLDNFNKDSKDPLIAVAASPAIDVAKAQEKHALVETDMNLRHDKRLAVQAGVEGKNVFIIHTHQSQLGENFTGTPTTEDIAIAEDHITKSPQGRYSWGVLTKSPDGAVHLALFSSFRTREGKIIHAPTGIVSPDMKEVISFPGIKRERNKQ